MKEQLRYLESHEWFSPETKKMGISAFAVKHLGEVVEVELPEVGDTFEKGDEIGTVESTKTASPIYAPVSGKVVAINEETEDSPELVSDTPFTDGWLVEFEITNEDEINQLLDFKAYEEHCAKEEE